MLTLSTPTYDMNMMKIKCYKGRLRQFSKFDLERSISDLGGKNSKFRLSQLLHMDLKYNPMQFHHSHIKTVWGVIKSAKKYSIRLNWHSYSKYICALYVIDNHQIDWGIITPYTGVYSGDLFLLVPLILVTIINFAKKGIHFSHTILH